jgi:hypothetical protein
MMADTTTYIENRMKEDIEGIRVGIGRSNAT